MASERRILKCGLGGWEQGASKEPSSDGYSLALQFSKNPHESQIIQDMAVASLCPEHLGMPGSCNRPKP